MFTGSQLPFIGRWLRKKEMLPTSEARENIGLTQLNGSTPMARAFPAVRHLAINLSIRAPDNEIEPTMNGRSFGPDAIACFHFRCKNVECINGGFELQEEITKAVNEKQADLTGRRVCRGWRSKRLINQQRCYYELNFKAHINYY